MASRISRVGASRVVITHLVDTDRLIDYLNDKLNARPNLANLIKSRALATSIIAVGEVREGLLKAQRPQMEEAFVALLSGMTVVGIDDETATTFAVLRSNLRQQGALIGDHDLWIAASAMRHGWTLITRDTHFERIPALKRDAMTGG